MKDKIKDIIKIIFAFILGTLIAGSSAYAATILFNSNEVSYNNSSSGLTANNVQSTIDKLANK